MEETKKLRCPLGVPGGVIATLLGLVGVVMNSIDFNLANLLISIALVLMGAPFIRFVLMVHSANDRLDEIEKKLNKK